MFQQFRISVDVYSLLNELSPQIRNVGTTALNNDEKGPGSVQFNTGCVTLADLLPLCGMSPLIHHQQFSMMDTGWGFKADEVDTAGATALFLVCAIPPVLMIAGIECSLCQSADQLAPDVIDL